MASGRHALEWTPRIGIRRAADRPWRCVWKGHRERVGRSRQRGCGDDWRATTGTSIVTRRPSRLRYAEREGRADALPYNRALDLLGARNRVSPADARHDVAGLEPGAVGRRPAIETVDVAAGDVEPVLFGGLAVDVDPPDIADRSPGDRALLDEFGHDATRKIRRNREADALVAARRRVDAVVDADELAPGVHERAAGVAGIDRRIGLNEVLHRTDLFAGPAARSRRSRA